MTFAFFGALLLALVFGPQLWAKSVFKKYAFTIHSLPGTGGELAVHFVKRLGLGEVRVEEGIKDENYYDPENKLVKLSPEYFHGKSLTAITVATHEIGHALQDHLNYRPLAMRSRLAKVAAHAEKAAAALLVAAPFLSLVTRTPVMGALSLLGGLTVLLLPVLLHLVTLPVEWDASFNRALPVLTAGGYIPAAAVPAAKKILTAAALTYLAGALASLLNFYRWIAFLRR